MVISRRQGAKALVMRLKSASIAATAVITAVRAAIKPRMAAERPATPSLALRALSMKAAVSARALGSVGDRRKLQKRAWSAAVRSAHDEGPAALCLLLWSLFLAEDREGVRRAGRFHDDRRARRARFSHDRRLQEASSAAAGEVVFAGAEAGGKSRVGEAGACRARRHEDQGQRLQTQGDELRTHEDARDGASRRSGSLA